MRRLVVCILVLLAGGCAAQTPLDRGRTLNEYNFPFNGHYFWNGVEYRPGTVYFNGVTYHGVSVNINAHTQELLVKQSQFAPPVAAEQSLTGWFAIDGICYVNLRYYGVKEAPAGFWISLQDGKRTVWMQRQKQFLREPGDHNGVGGIGYDDPNYRENIISYFRQKDYNYTAKRGTFKRIHPGKARRRAMIPSGIPPENNPEVWVAREIKRNNPLKGAGYELPPEWFSKNETSSERSTLLAAIEQEAMIASYRNKTYEIGRKGAGEGRAKVSGVVRDVASGEALGAVLVSDRSGRNYCYTDKEGRYSLSLPTGENLLTFREYSMEDMDIHVIVNSSGELDIVMREKVTALQSAYVTAEGMADHRRAGMGIEKLSQSTITHVPSAFGEGDIIKTVLTLPGVKSVGEASSGFNVRGGSSDQNLILLDGGTIYNPGHLFGIFSAFNTDVVDDIELYKSSIPVRYGGRISSVLDIGTRSGNAERLHGSLGLGILTSHLSLEGPIIKNRTSFVLGGRTTYSDWLLRQIPRSSGYAGGNASFSDVNLGLTHRIDERNSLKLTGYWSRDGFSFRGDTTFRYSNLDIALKWTRKRDEDHTLKVTAGFDQYSNTLQRGLESDPLGSYSLSTRIREGFARAGVEQRLGSHTISWGGDGVFYALQPGSISPLEGSAIIAKNLKPEMAQETAVYAGDLWQNEGPFSVEGGVRLSSFLALDPVKFYFTPEFRLSGKYSPLSNLSFKAGVNSMSQYIHLISNTSAISPMDTWRLAGADMLPQRGWQAAGGAYWTVFGNALDISLEAYYKRMYNCLDYKSGAVLSMNEQLSADLVRTTGRAYGVELMLRKQTGRLTGWLSYTWSRSMLKEMQDRGIETINGGNWYNAPHDKPHDLKLVGNYKFTHRYSISFNLDYSTGRPVTIPVGQYYYGNAVRLMYSQRNAYRIPDYFRLDLALNIEPGHYLKAFTHMSATLGCYNVTGRRNAYSVFYTTSGGNDIKGYMVSVFATQIPYLSLNLKF